jgi:transcriptional regulator with XRE-family HTH domain
MSADEVRVLDLWDLRPPPMPRRSRLYCLPPIGVGTPAVESLTGYVARLAATHRVLVRTLVVEEILPLLGRGYLLGAVNTGRSAFWQSQTQALNGTRHLARDGVRVLETLTLRTDLRFLTMQPWAEVVPAKGLLRRQRAWCPACYEAWRQVGQEIYEPLLWTLLPVVACPRHRRRLQQHCPHPECGRPLPLLGQRSRPGHCSACGRWLGDSAEAGPVGGEELTEAELQAQSWVVEAVGELLAGAPDLAVRPARPQLAAAIAVAVKEVAGGNVTGFARELGLNMGTVSQWCRGTAIPSLGLLLQACHRLGTTPLRLLTDDLVRARCAAGERPALEATGWVDAPQRALPLHRSFDVAAMRAALETVLASDEAPPPTMRQTAQRLGRAHAELIHHLPELCHAISARYLAYQHARGVEKRRRLCAEIRQAAVRLHGQGFYPSAYRIAPLISQPGFVRDPEAIAARKEALRELGWRT